MDKINGNTELKDSSAAGAAQELFEELERVARFEGVEIEEQKNMVVEIINVLRAHKLSYYQAEKILEKVNMTLKAISQQLHL